MKTSYIKGLVIFLLLLALVDCQKNTKPIVVGEEVEVTTETIGIEGGTITVSKPGDPLDGFKIEVPAGAYQEEKTFKISYRPIVQHQLGNKFNPITPMIYVENGGDIAEHLMTVTIPANISEGYFAMAFYYDETTGKLNGLPLIDETPTSLTIMTTHFSPIATTEIDEELLKDPVDSKFKHGVDDWQFVNYGSVVEPRGHCSGQCLSALYYYYQKSIPDENNKRKPDLYGLYDNDGNPDFKTPDFQWDDELAYKLCSMIHKKVNWDNMHYWGDLQKKYTHKWTFLSFAYSLALVELGLDDAPPFMGISRTLNKGTKQEKFEGHALIVYKKSERKKLADGSEVCILSVSDPNCPKQHGTECKKEIIYDIGQDKFRPYEFGIDDKGNKILYDEICYFETYSLIKKKEMEKFWSQVKDKSIGKGDFPEYSLTVVEADTEMSLYDGFKTSSGSITIKLCDISEEPFLFQQRLVIYKATINNKTGTVQEIDTYDLTNDDDDCLRATIEGLQEGDNIIGFLVQDKYKPDPLNKPDEIDWKFVGFDWLHIIREKDQTGGDLSQLTRCNIEVFNVVSSCQDTDGNNFEDITEPACHAEEGSFSGNTFNATYDIKSYSGHGYRKGTMTVVLDIDPSSNEILGVKSFSCEETVYANEEANVISHISGKNVPLLWDWSPRQKEFEGQDETVCESITSLERIRRSYDADNKEMVGRNVHG